MIDNVCICVEEREREREKDGLIETERVTRRHDVSMCVAYLLVTLSVMDASCHTHGHVMPHI